MKIKAVYFFILMFVFVSNSFSKGEMDSVVDAVCEFGNCICKSKVIFDGDKSDYYCFVFERRDKEDLPYQELHFYKGDELNFEPVSSFAFFDHFTDSRKIKGGFLTIWETGSACRIRFFNLVKGKPENVFDQGSICFPEFYGDFLVLGDFPKVFKGSDWNPSTAKIFKWNGSTFTAFKTCRWKDRKKLTAKK